jgi:hypothetical protein
MKEGSFSFPRGQIEKWPHWFSMLLALGMAGECLDYLTAAARHPPK